MRKRLNWNIIGYNLAEAREQLEQLEARIATGKRPSEPELQVMLEHAYHHLNFAWNVRHQPTRKYRNLSDANFKRWSKVPKVMESDKV